MTQLGCMADLWLFSHFTPAEKMRIQAMTRKPVYKKGEMLFWESDPATTVFLVTEGRVKLFKISEEGKEIILGFLTPHDLFGEEVLFSESTRSLSAVAMDTTRLCVCAKRDFEALIQQEPPLAMKVIQTLGEKLNQATAQVVDLALHDVKHRVVHVLVRLAKAYGTETPQGLSLDFRLTHEDIGALVGASRVMVTHVLQELRQAGDIALDGRSRFIIRAPLLQGTRMGMEGAASATRSLCPCFTERQTVL